MKTKNLKFIILLLPFVFGCSIDNYDPPSATLAGKVIDSGTNEMIENGGANGGTVIYAFEGNSKQPIISNSYPDGHFVNAAFFNGNYKVVAIGPFKMGTDTIPVTVSNNTEIEIKALPNVRLSAPVVSKDAGAVKIKVAYEKVHENQVLNELCVVWSTYPNPNMFTFAGGGQKIEKVASLKLTSGEIEFSISGISPGQNYYIRAAARTDAPGGYYNYSKPIQTQ